METRTAGIVVLVLLAFTGWGQWRRAVVTAKPFAMAVAALEDRKGEILVVLEKEERFRKESSELDRRLAELRRALPSELDVELFESRLREWSAALSVEVSSWRVAAPRTLDFYREQSISATLEGPEQALDELGSSRNALERAVSWEEVFRTEDRLDLRLFIFSRIDQPTEPPVTLCSRFDPWVPSPTLWPFGGRVAELGAERDRLCAFEWDHAATSRAIEQLTEAREEEARIQLLLHELVGAPAPEWVIP